MLYFLTKKKKIGDSSNIERPKAIKVATSVEYLTPHFAIIISETTVKSLDFN